MMERLFHIESGVLLWYQSIRTPWLNGVMSGISFMGELGMIWAAVCIILLLRKKTRRAGIYGAVALILGLILCNGIIKNIFERTRPYVVIEGLRAIGKLPPDTSFPSGHACSSFAAAFSIHFSLNKRWTVLLIVLALLMSVSRIYLGIHYPTDVLAGAAAGALCAWLSVKFVGRWLADRLIKE